MKRRSTAAVLLLAGAFLMGCSGQNSDKQQEISDQTQENSESSQEEKESEQEETKIEQENADSQQGDKESELPEAEETVYWGIPDLYRIDEEQLKAVNQRLFADGYDFRVEFVTRPFDSYETNLLSYTDELDIASAGLESEDYRAADLVRSGFFEPLSSYIQGADELWSTYSEKQWDSVRMNGEIYTIPNCVAEDEGVTYVFNTKYVTQDQIDAFDLSFSSLQEILEQIPEQAEFSPLIFDLSNYDYTSLADCYCENGMIYSENQDEIIPVEDSTECMDIQRKLAEYADLGYLNYDMSLSSEDSGQSACRTLMEKGDFAVLIQIGKFDSASTQAKVKTRERTPILYSRLSASTGIVAASKRKEDAFALLKLVYTNTEYQKMLIEDVAGKNAQDSEDGDSYLTSLMIGTNLYQKADQKEQKEYYDSKVQSSKYLGFQPDYTTQEENIRKMIAIDQANLDLWKEEDVEGAILNFQKKAKEAGSGQVAEELNKQYKDWSQQK